MKSKKLGFLALVVIVFSAFLYLVWVFFKHAGTEIKIPLLNKVVTTLKPEAASQLTSDVLENLIIIPNVSDAYCLDGSLPSLYYRKGKDKDRWFLYMKGGGWCYSVKDCYRRSRTNYGSSKYLPSTITFTEKDHKGYLSPDPKINPDFAAWNLVWYNYCDGASFSGNRKNPVEYNGHKIYFKGRNILDIVLDYTMIQLGMEKAERIILGGYSAGALAVIIHADYIKSKLPANVKFHTLSDVGFFLNLPNIRNKTDFQEKMRNMYTIQNIDSDALDLDCVSNKVSEELWQCIFPQYVCPYVQTPMFVIQPTYDQWTIKYILDIRCHPSRCQTEQLQFLKNYFSNLMKIVNTSLIHSTNSKNNALYMPSCFSHLIGHANYPFMHYSIKNVTIRQALSDWYFREKNESFNTDNIYVDECDTPNCNPTC